MTEATKHACTRHGKTRHNRPVARHCQRWVRLSLAPTTTCFLKVSLAPQISSKHWSWEGLVPQTAPTGQPETSPHYPCGSLSSSSLWRARSFSLGKSNVGAKTHEVMPVRGHTVAEQTQSCVTLGTCVTSLSLCFLTILWQWSRRTSLCSNCHTTELISHASKIMLKILQARLQQYTNREFSEAQAGFRKGRRTRDQMPTSIYDQMPNHRKGKGIPEKHLLLLHWLC